MLKSFNLNPTRLRKHQSLSFESKLFNKALFSMLFYRSPMKASYPGKPQRYDRSDRIRLVVGLFGEGRSSCGSSCHETHGVNLVRNLLSFKLFASFSTQSNSNKVSPIWSSVPNLEQCSEICHALDQRREFCALFQAFSTLIELLKCLNHKIHFNFIRFCPTLGDVSPS